MADSIEQTGNETGEAPAVVAGKESGPGLFALIRNFFREVFVELKKTNWPTPNELVKFTVVVMVTIVAVAIALFLMDQIAQYLMKYALKQTG